MLAVSYEQPVRPPPLPERLESTLQHRGRIEWAGGVDHPGAGTALEHVQIDQPDGGVSTPQRLTVEVHHLAVTDVDAVVGVGAEQPTHRQVVTDPERRGDPFAPPHDSTASSPSFVPTAPRNPTVKTAGAESVPTTATAVTPATTPTAEAAAPVPASFAT